MAKATTRSSIISEQKHLGREPEFSGGQLSKVELIKALNWYNHFCDNDAAKSYVTDYCKARKLRVAISKHKTNTYAWLMRIVDRGGILDPITNNRLSEYVTTLTKSVPTITNDNSPPTEERVANRLGQWIPDLEEAVDNFKEPFNCYSYISTHGVPQTYVKQIRDFYEPVLTELVEAYEKVSSDLVEAYRIYSRTDLKALVTRVKAIIEDCDKYLGNVKKERKPRKKRGKSMDSVLKYFKYLKHDDNLKLSSDDPSKIVGASAVYVLNTKYKTLTMFVAKDNEGLNINRTAISNFDEKQSKTKRVGRKLEDVVNQITNGTKRSRMKVLDTVKSDLANFTDRLNEHSLIVKVDK